MRRRRWKFDPLRTRPRTASERIHRKMVGGILKMLRREIRQSKRGE